ncbi:MAG: glycosyl hydrolase [Bacteroidales bacterium]|nr:glycosyl hydrolase [Bacteroidales bacterium]
MRLLNLPKSCLLAVVLCCTTCLQMHAQTLVTSVEAEKGVLSGGVVTSNSASGYSGTGYVTNFRSSADKVTVTVTVPAKAFYKMVIRYRSTDYKEQNVWVNSDPSFSVKFPASSLFTDADAGKVLLNEGVNTISLQSSWGWSDVDKFSLYSVPRNTYSVAEELVNPNATEETKALYNFLRSNYGSKIISGQTSSYTNELKAIAGKSPMLKGFDFQHYTEGYPYNWVNGGFGFGIDKGCTESEDAINWYKSTNGKGIVCFQWHWHSPSNGTVGTNTFYSEYTTFDVSKAVVPGNKEYTEAIRDIDAIAAQLKKFQDAKVPVIFRPLHEASGNGVVNGSGAWFWWGAKGAKVCVKLYDIIYDRLTNYHGLNNIIWTWSSSESAWYPGNDKVDIVGHDSYPGNYNYSVKKNDFDILYTMVNGEKIVAMTENGPIPDPDDCFALDAPWSFFMSWGDLVNSSNSAQHIKKVFNNGNVLILEPSKPQKPEGIASLSVNPENQTYSTQKVDGATSYLWKIIPITAGKKSGSDTVVTIDFADSYIGDVKLIVSGRNALGIGQTSDTLLISISENTSLKEAVENSLVSIYSDKASGRVAIHVDPQVGSYNLTIFKSSGEIIYKQNNSTSALLSLDLSSRPAGVYCVSVTSAKVNIKDKFLISR